MNARQSLHVNAAQSACVMGIPRASLTMRGMLAIP
jgi:hypothetical protein